jgi:hypothetical protein
VIRRTVLFGSALLALSSALVIAATETPIAFVQRFYDSYLRQNVPDWGRTVRTRRQLFAPALADALQEDSTAQAKATGDVVGIDFDPFLGSQDPGNRFVARGAFPIPTGYRVQVYDIESGSRGKPMVLVDIAPKDGSWIITDFRYPQTSSELLSILRSLRQSRVTRHFR